MQGKLDAAIKDYRKEVARGVNVRKQLNRLVRGTGNTATFLLTDAGLRRLGVDPAKYIGAIGAIIVLGANTCLPSYACIKQAMHTCLHTHAVCMHACMAHEYIYVCTVRIPSRFIKYAWVYIYHTRMHANTDAYIYIHTRHPNPTMNRVVVVTNTLFVRFYYDIDVSYVNDLYR